MFLGILKQENRIFFKIDNDIIACPLEYNDIVLNKLKLNSNKVINLFSDIINNKLCNQDLIDYHLDSDIDWGFIKIGLSISNNLGKK